MTEQTQMLREIESEISQLKLLIESDEARLAANPASKAIQRSIMSWTYELNDLESKFRSLNANYERIPVTIELEQLDKKPIDSEWEAFADLINRFAMECAFEPRSKSPNKEVKIDAYTDLFCIEFKDRYRSTIRARRSNLFKEGSISSLMKLIPYLLQSKDERSFLGACVSLGLSPAKRLGELIALLSALNVAATLSWESKDKHITTFIKRPNDRENYFSKLDEYIVSDDYASGTIEPSDMATLNVCDTNDDRYMIFCRNPIERKAAYDAITKGAPLALHKYTFNHAMEQHTIFATNCTKFDSSNKV